MFAFSVLARRPLHLLGAVAALLMGSLLAGQRAEAVSLLNPSSAGIDKAIAGGSTIEVRGGHGGGGGGGGHGGGFGAGHGAAVAGGAVAGGAIGAGAAAAGGPRFAGHPFFHRRHAGIFIGGAYYDDYPYDDGGYYDYPPIYSDPAFVAGGGCRRVMTVHGPRVFCHHRAARHHHRIYRHHHHRRHHRA
jgi:hypothetical protein